MIQVDLERKTPLGTKLKMSTWLENDPRVKEGYEITLKGSKSGQWWTIVKIYETVIDISAIESNRNWDNNNYDKHNTKSMKERLK